MTIQELMKECHETAKKKGWWDKDVDGRTFGDICALLHSEVSEAFEDYRNGCPITMVAFENSGKPYGIPTEFADIIIRLMDTCAAYGIDIESALKEKLAYNKTRPHRHGGKVL